MLLPTLHPHSRHPSHDVQSEPRRSPSILHRDLAQAARRRDPDAARSDRRRLDRRASGVSRGARPMPRPPRRRTTRPSADRPIRFCICRCIWPSASSCRSISRLASARRTSVSPRGSARHTTPSTRSWSASATTIWEAQRTSLPPDTDAYLATDRTARFARLSACAARYLKPCCARNQNTPRKAGCCRWQLDRSSVRLGPDAYFFSAERPSSDWT